MALLDVVDGLPANSHFASAVRADPDQVALTLAEDDPDDEAEWAPSDREWTLELEILATICELLANLGNTSTSDRWTFPRPVDLAAQIREHWRIQDGYDAFAELGIPLV